MIQVCSLTNHQTVWLDSPGSTPRCQVQRRRSRAPRSRQPTSWTLGRMLAHCGRKTAQLAGEGRWTHHRCQARKVSWVVGFWNVNWRKGKSFTWKPFVFFVFVGFFQSNWGGSCKMSLKHPEWPFGSRMMTIGAAGLKYLKMAPKQVIRIAALDRLEICARTYTRGPYILLSLYICVVYFIYLLLYYIYCAKTDFDPIWSPQTSKKPHLYWPPENLLQFPGNLLAMEVSSSSSLCWWMPVPPGDTAKLRDPGAAVTVISKNHPRIQHKIDTSPTKTTEMWIWLLYQYPAISNMILGSRPSLGSGW